VIGQATSSIIARKPRLSTAVPRRDRAAHLAALLPHLVAYFARVLVRFAGPAI